MSERHDLIVIGAGPAGYAAAIRAHDLGKRVLLVEKGEVGGAGVRAGALSSKTMWHLSNDFREATRTDRGFSASSVELRYTSVIEAVSRAVKERTELMNRQLEQLAFPSPSGGSVRREQGRACFVDPYQIAIERPDGSTDRFSADHFLIATGSSPRTLPGISTDGRKIITSDHVEELDDFPESMVIVGAGVVGCEYATIFANFGRTKIHVIDRQPRILPFEDEDVAAIIADDFERRGVTIHHGATLESLEVVGDRVEYAIRDPRGVVEKIRVDRALISVGRSANVDGLGLERAGVEIDPGHGIRVQDTRTTAGHIYAAGDVSRDIALANVAELEGRHAVELMFGLSPPPIVYDALSTIMFLSPEVAAVGLNELQCRERGLPYRAGVVRNRLIDRYIAMRETIGFVKLLATPEDPAHILGMRIVGQGASSAIQGIAFLIEKHGTLGDVDRCVHPHPAVTAGVQECARLLLGRSIHKLEVFEPDLLQRRG